MNEKSNQSWKNRRMEKGMTLYRFCSYSEASKLMGGQTITNTTDHFRGGKGGSTSRGFCLTEDEPEKAWKYLKGIVTPEICLMFDIPLGELTESEGKYVGKTITYPGGVTRITPDFKREWCTGTLRPEWLKGVTFLESLVPDYELEVARYVHKCKQQIKNI